tara:strand:- start:889 stop:1224 length:336 start_codon:yes stop_codon:yes gene_type:complete
MDKATGKTTGRDLDAEDCFWKHLLNAEALLLLLSNCDQMEESKMRRALEHIAEEVMAAKDAYFIIEDLLMKAYPPPSEQPAPEPQPLSREVGNAIIAETRRQMSRKAKVAK